MKIRCSVTVPIEKYEEVRKKLFYDQDRLSKVVIKEKAVLQRPILNLSLQPDYTAIQFLIEFIESYKEEILIFLGGYLTSKGLDKIISSFKIGRKVTNTITKDEIIKIIKEELENEEDSR